MTWAQKRKSIASADVIQNPEDWDYFDCGELKSTMTSRVCMTCEHFRYASTKSCVTLLTCSVYRRLIPQGAHLTKRCTNWQKKSVLDIGQCPRVARNLDAT